MSTGSIKVKTEVVVVVVSEDDDGGGRNDGRATRLTDGSLCLRSLADLTSQSQSPLIAVSQPSQSHAASYGTWMTLVWPPRTLLRVCTRTRIVDDLE